MSDVESFRKRFPALERVHNGFPVAYFDGPGGTQVPRDVVDAMSEYLLHNNANTEWAYPTSEETDAAIARSRETLADFLGGAPSEIAFGANMTTLTFHVSRALGRAWTRDDVIVVTELDHHANIDPWRRVSAETGVRIEMARLDPATGELDADDLDRKLALAPRLLAISAASNALGTMPDVAAIAALAKAGGALVYVDAVHCAPHTLVDVRALGCDFLACSAYKFYGPHIGVLWGRHELLESLDVPRVRPAHNEAPDRLETGTQNHEGMVGAAAAVDFLASFGAGATRRARLETSYAALHQRASDLFVRLWNGLASIDGVTLFGPPPGRPRTATLSFTLRGVSPRSVAERCAARGLFVSHGDFYASTVAERMAQRDGFVRIGLAAYSSAEEVERLLEGVAAIR